MIEASSLLLAIDFYHFAFEIDCILNFDFLGGSGVNVRSNIFYFLLTIIF